MNTIARNIFFKSVIYNRKSDVYIWYFVASWACEVIVILPQNTHPSASLCEDFSDLTSPTSNQRIKLFLLYMALFRNSIFTHESSYCSILHLYCDIRLSLPLV